MGLFEPARDDNAFRRLKTVIAFLRSRMGYQGFLIAFDEGTRTSSFRRGVYQAEAVDREPPNHDQSERRWASSVA